MLGGGAHSSEVELECLGQSNYGAQDAQFFIALSSTARLSANLPVSLWIPLNALTVTPAPSSSSAVGAGAGLKRQGLPFLCNVSVLKHGLLFSEKNMDSDIKQLTPHLRIFSCRWKYYYS